jgi:hypothetical protein
VWDKCELKWPRLEMEGQPVEAFARSSSVHACLFSFCAAFSKLAITPSSEVEMACHLLGWNLNFTKLPVMYHLGPVSSRDGTDLDVKLMLLRRILESRVRNPSQLGQQSWCPPCNLLCSSRNPTEKPLVLTRVGVKYKT